MGGPYLIENPQKRDWKPPECRETVLANLITWLSGEAFVTRT